MKKIFSIGVLVITALFLASCNQSGLEKISFKEAENKLEDTKGEYIAFVNVEDNTSEEYKKLLEEVSKEHKIYYVNITDEIMTSDYYKEKFTAKYPNTTDGIMITNDGKAVKDNKVFEFSIDTNINGYRNTKYDFEEAIKAVNNFLEKEG